MDTSHTTLLSYDPQWPQMFEAEAQQLQAVFGDAARDVQHIGSTAVPELSAKPIIDIMVLIPTHADADGFVEPLKALRYQFDEAAHAKGAAPERHFFRKGAPTTFHLSVAYADRGSFWKRQLLFRDYLRSHPEVRDEYARIKERALVTDPTGRDSYISQKTEFIESILAKAGFIKNW
jgi:GrpB-like predicted nucleotidyltransferase (UPF0157 family)